MSALGWTARHGETVHLHPRNVWRLPAGRYILRAPGAGETDWRLENAASGHWRRASALSLTEAEATMILTPISAEELAREREKARMIAAAPLRACAGHVIVPQHDASDLGLFRAANEPRLI